ncbi:MAG: cell division protein ZapA [Lachnospiraceae bacterium]|jgi:cell division protein ZapA|nr:cell division protein ZapA [Lachnospiraceae bacterium]MCI1329276.1 cell division protein ZapA [Lachnospiraceae bacterium]
MAEKNTIKVTIDGKSISIGGYESTEYLEHVAFYINNKIGEMKELPGYSRQSAEMKTILLALNVADDYYKAKTRADALEEDIEAKDGEWYSAKQDLANAQVRIHELERELASRAGAAAAYEEKTPAAAYEEKAPEAAYEEKTPAAAYKEKAPAAADKTEERKDGSAPESGEDGGSRNPDRKLNDKYLKRSRRYAKTRS